jgi:flagellar assembly factor FliW
MNLLFLILFNKGQQFSKQILLKKKSYDNRSDEIMAH